MNKYILPGVATVALGLLILKSTCQDSRRAATIRFKNALINKDINQLYEFMEPEERETIRISKESFAWLMKNEFFKEWNFSQGQWNFEITKGAMGENLLCESLSDPKSSSSLSFKIVGEPGHFRCPAFVYFVLQATALKRFGVDRTLPGGLSRRAPLLRLLNEDIQKLEDAGIFAYYDNSQHSASPLREMRNKFSEDIDKWRSAQPQK